MMRGRMKALVKSERGPGLDLREVNIPSIGDRDVLIRVLATSICGTDYHIYSWDEWSQGRIQPPIIAGHEFVGEVVEFGEDVTDVQVGDLVTAETHIVCGRCLQCRMNQRHVCAETRIIGVDVDGCFAEYVALPAVNLWPTDRELDIRVASAQEPLGNAVHTALAGPVAGARVAVTGCGPIGLMSIAVLRHCGARQVIATEVNPYRIELAARMGADAVIDVKSEDVVSRVRDLTGGVGVDGVLEMSGHPAAIDQAMKMVRPGGRVSLLGVPSGSQVSLDVGGDIVFRGVNVQ
ncbi:MAG: L-threonine 3-dehydrogenase, partial [Bacillota bacterium]